MALSALFVSALAVAPGSMAIRGYNAGGNAATGTFFAKIAAGGQAVSGCGLPPNLMVDDGGKAIPYVALNVGAEFKGGANCGRWVKITLGENCAGGTNSEWSVCNGGRTHRPRI
jgi:hypothetical protein